MFLGVLDQDDCHTFVVKLGPPGSAHHLEHISDWIVDIALGLAIIILCPLHHNQVCRKVDPPSKGARCYENLLDVDTTLYQWL